MEYSPREWKKLTASYEDGKSRMRHDPAMSRLGDLELLEDLIAMNKNDFAALIITEEDARKLKNCTFVDFCDEAKYKKGHIKGANYVDYSNMFSKPMMEKLNKSNNLIIIHDIPAVAGVIAATLKLMDYPDVYILK